MVNRFTLSSLALVGLVQPACAYDVRTRLELEPLIVKHDAANNVPAPLVHRVIMRESRYNARAVGRGGALGLMQIKHGTARALGYAGPASGLLDADTNLTYAVRYLAGAYRVADGDHNRAVGFYARGYYYDAKRRGMLRAFARGPAVTEQPAAVPVAAPQPPPSIFSLVFTPPRAPEPVQEAGQTAVEEPEVPVARKRSSRSDKRKDIKAPVHPSATTAEPAQDVAQVVVEEPDPALVRKPSSRAGKRKDAQASAPTNSQGAPSAAAQPVVTEDATRSGRSAGRSAAAGGDRSGRRVSAQPGDPGRHP